MNWNIWVLAGGILLFASLLSGCTEDPFASECIYKEEDKNWSFLSFYNSCKKPINVVFCNKLSLGELAQLFGYKTGEWDCKSHYVRPGYMFATIKWVNEQSSVASHLLSTSRYVVAACHIPAKPRFTEGNNYKCVK